MDVTIAVVSVGVDVDFAGIVLDLCEAIYMVALVLSVLRSWWDTYTFVRPPLYFPLRNVKLRVDPNCPSPMYESIKYTILGI